MGISHRLSNITALLITGFITVATFGMCTAGNYQFGPYTSMKECDEVDAFADYYPSNTNLSFAKNSSCRPGKMRCTLFTSDIDGGNTLRWSVTQNPLLDAGIEGTQCNGFDDNCNGIVDDIPGLGSVCYAGYGACKQAGVRNCPDLSFCSAPSIADMGDNKYHRYPFVDPESQEYTWNWSCNNRSNPATFPNANAAIFALSGSFDQRGATTASASISLAGTTMTQLCRDSACTGPAGTVNYFLANATSTAASIFECGKPYILLKCQSTGATPSCSDAGYDTAIVACR